MKSWIRIAFFFVGLCPFSLGTSVAETLDDQRPAVPQIQDFQRMVAEAVTDATEPGMFRLFSKEHWQALQPAADLVLEGEALRNFLQPMQSWAQGALNPVLSSLVRVRIHNEPTYSDYALQWRGPVQLRLKRESQANQFELYELRTPAQLKLRVSMRDGVLVVRAPDSSKAGFDFLMRIPVLPNALRFRSAELDLTSGAARVVIGAVNNSVALVANAQLYAFTGPRLDLWQSFRENFSWIPGFSWIFG